MESQASTQAKSKTQKIINFIKTPKTTEELTIEFSGKSWRSTMQRLIDKGAAIRYEDSNPLSHIKYARPITAFYKSTGKPYKTRSYERRSIINSEWGAARPSAPVDADQLISIEDLMEWLSVRSKQTIYSLMKDSGLPRPIRVGPRVNRWVKNDVERWVQSLIHERDAHQADHRRN